MARHSTQLSLDEERYRFLEELAESQRRTERGARKREALTRLGLLRRNLLARTGGVSSDPIAEARMERGQQRDEVLRPARER